MLYEASVPACRCHREGLCGCVKTSKAQQVRAQGHVRHPAPLQIILAGEPSAETPSCGVTDTRGEFGEAAVRRAGWGHVRSSDAGGACREGEESRRHAAARLAPVLQDRGRELQTLHSRTNIKMAQNSLLKPSQPQWSSPWSSPRYTLIFFPFLVSFPM